MKFKFFFYKFNNISPINLDKKILNNNKSIKKEKFESINKCKKYIREKLSYNYFGFLVYNYYVYYIKLNFFEGIQKLKYHDKVLLYIYTNQDLDIKSSKERLNFYVHGFIKYFEKYNKMNNKYDIILHYNRGKYNSVLNNRSWEFSDRYSVINKNNLKNILKRIDSKVWIHRHYKNMLYYLNCRGNRDNMKLRISPYDMSKSFSIPTFVKSRPINDRRLSILLPLEDLYLPHNRLNEINNDINYNKKKNTLVWRGCDSGIFNTNLVNPIRGSRKLLVQKYCFHKDKRIDIGLSKIKYNVKNDLGNEYKKFVKGYMPISKQLESKFIICVEGNDFPTNILWVFLSNSVPIMPNPYIESWFMENNLKPWKHYIPVRNNFDDLKEKFEYCLNNDRLCKNIAINSKLYALQFLDINKENNLIQDVIDYYKNCII